MKLSITKIKVALRSGEGCRSKSLLVVPPFVRSSCSGLVAFGLSLVIFSGAVALPGCGSPEQMENASEVDGVGSKLGEVIVPAAKTTSELAAIRKALVKSMASQTAKTTAIKPREQLKSSIMSSIAANKGIPREQLKQVLTDVLDPAKAACGGASCSQVYGIKASEVDKYLDEMGDDVAKSKRLQEPDKQAVRKQLLGSLRRESDEGLDIPCSRV